MHTNGEVSIDNMCDGRGLCAEGGGLGGGPSQARERPSGHQFIMAALPLTSMACTTTGPLVVLLAAVNVNCTPENSLLSTAASCPETTRESGQQH